MSVNFGKFQMHPPQQWRPLPLQTFRPPPQRQQQQRPMQHHQFIRMQPELLIQTVTAAKILEEQREARTNQSPFNFGMQRVHPQRLIQSVTESKIAQKRTAAKFKAEQKWAQKAQQAKRTVQPLDFAKLAEDSVLKLADFMAALPASYDKEFRYGDLVKPVPMADANGMYSKEQILTVGAQLEMAKFRAAEEAAKVAMAGRKN